MTWVWVRCRKCGRKVQAHDIRWDDLLKMEACTDCLAKARQKREEGP